MLEIAINETTINEISNAVNSVNQHDGDGQIVVKASKERKKIDAINPFVLCFYNSLFEIIQAKNLSRASILLLLKLLDMTAMGNMLSLNQKGLAKQLKTSTSALSRQVKELKNASLILETDCGLFLNPQVITKGSLERLSKNDQLAMQAIHAIQAMSLSVNHGSESQLRQSGVI